MDHRPAQAEHLPWIFDHRFGCAFGERFEGGGSIPRSVVCKRELCGGDAHARAFALLRPERREPSARRPCFAHEDLCVQDPCRHVHRQRVLPPVPAARSVC
jgi:hypothetical protein